VSFLQANVYQHFRKDEHPFIDIVSNWIEQVEMQYAPVITEFLNPREMFILQSIVGKRDDVLISFFGGFDNSERKCAILYPSYYEPTESDYDIAVYQIKYPIKFGNLTHGKILGTLMSTGIKREYVGDIITNGAEWQFFIKCSVANYVAQQIDKIGAFGVKFDEIGWQDILTPTDEWLEENITISSLRIDNIISTVYNISRQRAKLMIESKKAKVNWTEIERVDFPVDYLDIVSVRGLGRVQLMETMGNTRKEKLRLKIRVLRK